jgi:Ca2+-binding EF-hand superfamily protein
MDVDLNGELKTRARTSFFIEIRLMAEADDPVPRNEFGGVLIDEEELKAAFDFFDVSKKGTLTPADLKARLSVFYKNLPAREYKFLISEPEFSYKTLHKLLVNNELAGFDPVKEAFKVYDPHDTGFVDVEVLKTIFSNLGFGEVNEDDLSVLIDTADVDRDGRISLSDFRNMMKANKGREQLVSDMHAKVAGSVKQ